MDSFLSLVAKCAVVSVVFSSFINFALAPPESRGGASLARCPLPDLEASTPPPTMAPAAVTVPAGWPLLGAGCFNFCLVFMCLCRVPFVSYVF